LKVELVISDRFGDMIEDRLDIALRVGEITDSSLIKRRSWTGSALRSLPELYRAACKPSVPADLEHHTCIVHNVGSIPTYGRLPRPRTQTDPYKWWISCKRLSCGTAGCRIGYGIALLPLLEVFDDLQSGQLFSLLSAFPLLAFQLAWSIHRGGTWRHVPA